jgi:serine/threonine protein kinase
MEAHGLSLRNSRLGIITPVAETNLQQILDTGPAAIADYQHIRNYLGCLASALAIMHEAKICHGDIKSSNILISNGRAVLSGFGRSHFDYEDEESPVTAPNEASGLRKSSLGLRKFSLSERKTDLKSSVPGRRYDIWSLGCVYIEILAWLHEADNMRDGHSKSALEQPIERLHKLQSIDPHIVPPDQSAMIAHMISDPLNERPTAAELVRTFPCDHSEKPSEKHPLITQLNDLHCSLRASVGKGATLQAADASDVNRKVLDWIRTTHNGEVDHSLNEVGAWCRSTPGQVSTNPIRSTQFDFHSELARQNLSVHTGNDHGLSSLSSSLLLLCPTFHRFLFLVSFSFAFSFSF